MSTAADPGAQGAGSQGLNAVLDRLDVAARRADEQLARAADLVLGVADHLVELGDPAHRAGQREDGGEQATGMPIARCTMPE